jgi:hypothetical protein
MSLDDLLTDASPELPSKPNIEPIKRPRAKRPTKNSPRRKERAPGAPIHRDKPRAKDRPEAVNWDVIRALHTASPATCVAYREDLTPDLQVWRIVLAVKLPKGVANSLNPKVAAPVFNLPLLAQGLDGAGRQDVAALG